MTRVAPIFVGLLLSVQPGSAQMPDLVVDTRVTFYGDNTEFSNPFQEGETLLGTFADLVVEAKLSDRLTLMGGVFGNERFGSDEGFDEVRPVLALVIGSPRSRLVLGTLDTVRRIDGAGPDRIGPHDLLPPIQRETLAFERPWEAGLQWTLATARVKQDVWIHWQRVNTRGQREVFDTGLTSRVGLRHALALRGDVHLVHQGGQLSASGPVADSFAAALGIEAGGPAGRIDRVSLEALALASRSVPDRERPRESRTGGAAFVRASVEEAGWRLHGIMWRGDDFTKAEGNPLYQSIRRSGAKYRGLRDYAEAGLTGTFPLAPGSSLEMSARWHRVESDYEYSFRVLAVAKLRVRVSGRP
jgi:hypothetical protein